MNPLTPQPFRYECLGDSPKKDIPGDANSDHKLLPHQLSRGWNHNRCRRDLWLLPPQAPPLSPDCRFESDRSSVSTALLMSLLLDWSESSQHPQRGRQHGETRAYMTINLPVFKDEDTKDAVIYQSWRWDLMVVYHHAGCWDHTLLPYTIQSLQGYPRELVWSLDNVLMILDESYNNMKALDTLNQEKFQLQMVDKETITDWGICLSSHLQVLAASFPNHFHHVHVAELNETTSMADCPKGLKQWWPILRPAHMKRLILITYSRERGRKGRIHTVIPKSMQPGNW